MEMISRLLLTYLTNSLWIICIIAGIATVCSKLLRRAPSIYMHVMWVAALVIASFLPLVSLLHANSNSGAMTPLVQAGGQHLSSEAVPTAAPPQKLRFYWWHRSKSLPLTPFLTWVLVAGYAIFVCYRGARLGWAWKQTNRIRRAACSRPLPENLLAVAGQCFGALRVSPVAILYSSAIQGPLTLGIRKPVLILPERFFAQVTEGDLACALCHEMAHIRRYDFLLNLIYEVLLLPLSYHPFALLIKTRVDQSRELACDETAAKFSTREAYARSLFSIAQSMSAGPSATASGYALGLFDTNTLEERIMILLDKKNRLSKSWGRILAIATVGCLLLVSMGAAAFSLQPAQSADTSPSTGPDVKKFPARRSVHVRHNANDAGAGPHVRVAKMIITASTIDKTEMDVDAFASEIEGLKNLRSGGWLEEVEERTRDFWQSHGFFEPQVDTDSKLLSATPDEQVFSVTARVDAGAQYHLKKLEFSGAKVFTTSELEGMMPIRPGEIFSTAQVRKGLETLRAACVSKGYKQCIPEVDTTLDDSDHTITLKLVIAEGP